MLHEQAAGTGRLGDQITGDKPYLWKMERFLFHFECWGRCVKELREKWRVPVFTCFCFLSLVALAGCGMNRWAGDKPVVRLSLGITAEELQDLSEYDFGDGFSTSKHLVMEVIDVPHTFIYDDPDLYVEIVDAGALKPLATMLNFSTRLSPEAPPSRLESVSVSGTSDYVRLTEAIERGRELHSLFLEQGFSDDLEEMLVGSRPGDAEWPEVHTFEDLESAFLNSEMYVSRALVFDMSKNHIGVTMKITNARRQWGGARWNPI